LDSRRERWLEAENPMAERGEGRVASPDGGVLTIRVGGGGGAG
jgi:hypothetical protein